jgi:hypothetical protein
MILSAAAPAPAAVEWEFSWQLADDLALDSPALASLAQSPATPPPRA